MGLKQRLEDRLHREVEKSQEDVAWALEKNEDAAKTANKMMSQSVYLTLGKGLLVFFVALGMVKALSFTQLLLVVYLYIGVMVAKYSDYGWKSFEAYIGVFAWLPIIVLGMIKKII